MKKNSDESRLGTEKVAREDAATPRRRFRIERLEERIAPAGHYNKQSKWVGGNGNASPSDTLSGGTSSVY